MTAKSSRVSNLKVLVSIIERRIYLVRGKKVMLSNDLAELYGVEVRALVQAVKRNIDRFPDDFIFQLNNQEYLLGWRPPSEPLCLHRTRCRDALQRASKQTSDTS